MNVSAEKRFAVIGNPIVQSQSPWIHQRFAKQFALAIAYDKILATDENFAATVTTFFQQGGAGLNVTSPFKQAAFQLCQQLSERAQQAQGVNTLWLDQQGKLCGDSTDGAGLIRDLQVNHHLSLHGLNILLIGAGGVSQSILAALTKQKPLRIDVVNRSRAKAEKLIKTIPTVCDMSCYDYDSLPTQTYDIILHATSLGLQQQVPPLKPQVISEQTVCYDLSYGQAATYFLNWAKQHGAKTSIDGFGMLVEQAAEAFAIWHQQQPDTQALLNSSAV